MSALPDQERRTRYSPVAATLDFRVNFVIYDDDDVAVYHDGVEIDASLWTITASYVQGESADAVVVVSDPAGWSNVVVDIVGRRRPRRTDQFADGVGVPAWQQNLIINQVIAALRERYDSDLRSLRAPPGETIAAIPAAAVRAGLVLAFDSNGNPEGSDLIGAKGWSPVFALVSDSARRVYQLVGYVGGEGDAPTDDIGMYVGSAGYVSSISDGVDVRGPQGTSGAGTGDMLAANNLSDVDDASTARTNLGLGAAAVAGFGTTHSDVAYGDHTHDTRYYTQAQVTSAIAAATPTLVGDSGSGGVKGLVPAPAAGDAAAGKFLKADGSFAVPAASGGWTQIGGVYTVPSTGNSYTVSGLSLSGYRQLAIRFNGVPVSNKLLNLYLSSDGSTFGGTALVCWDGNNSGVTTFNGLVMIDAIGDTGIPKTMVSWTWDAAVDAVTTGVIQALKLTLPGGTLNGGTFTIWGIK